MKSVVVAGHVCVDIIPAVERAFDPEPGRLYEVGSAMLATGGVVSNTGVALHLLGTPTVLMGKIGDDNFGRSVLDLFQQKSAALTDGMRIVPGETTSYTIVLSIPGRDRTFLHCPGANHTFSATDIQYEQVAQAALFHFGYPPLMRTTYAADGAELEQIYARIKKDGVTTSLDMAMPDPDGPSGQADWSTILRRVLPFVDVFLPSIDELVYMLNSGPVELFTGADFSTLGAQLLEMGVGIAGFKLGEHGLYLRTAGIERLRTMGAAVPENLEQWADRELWFPVYQVEDFVGATGAGDTTIAGFLAALLRNLTPEQAGAVATRVGAFNVRTADALSGIRDWATTCAALADPVMPLPTAGGNWRAADSGRYLIGPADRG